MLCVDKQYGVVNKTQHLEVKPSITWEHKGTCNGYINKITWKIFTLRFPEVSAVSSMF